MLNFQQARDVFRKDTKRNNISYAFNTLAQINQAAIVYPENYDRIDVSSLPLYLETWDKRKAFMDSEIIVVEAIVSLYKNVPETLKAQLKVSKERKRVAKGKMTKHQNQIRARLKGVK